MGKFTVSQDYDASADQGQRRLPGNPSASSTCSGLSQNNGDFTRAFQAFTSGGGGPLPSPPPPPPPPGCASAWNNATAYVSGDQVSDNGHNWTANQWNYDEVSGGPSGAWNDDGFC